MDLYIFSYFAGILTVAAPCVLSVLPIIIGGSLIENKTPQSRRWRRPLLITISLAVSVVLFTLLSKTTTALLGVPQFVWNIVSGVIILLLGLHLLLPTLWEHISLKTGLYKNSNKLMQLSAGEHAGWAKDVLTGVALGPVFSSCSPTYALIVAVILPQSFFSGLSYLVAYVLGLATMLLLIALAGQSVANKLGWLANPSGWFRKIIGIIFVVVAVGVLTGLDRSLQSFVLETGWYDPIMHLEQGFTTIRR